MGQIPQTQEVLLRKLVRLPGSSEVVRFESSRRRNAPSSLALVSILRTEEAPHAGQRQRRVPAFVLPSLFIVPPHTAHFGFATGLSRLEVTPLAEKVA